MIYTKDWSHKLLKLTPYYDEILIFLLLISPLKVVLTTTLFCKENNHVSYPNWPRLCSIQHGNQLTALKVSNQAAPYFKGSKRNTLNIRKPLKEAFRRQQVQELGSKNLAEEVWHEKIWEILHQSSMQNL